MSESNAHELLSKVYADLAKSGSESGAMDEQINYEALTRQQQRALVRLFGGGTLRGQDEMIVSGLHRMGLIKGEKLTGLGRAVCQRALPAVLARVTGNSVATG
jgi:hypothetical protein